MDAGSYIVLQALVYPGQTQPIQDLSLIHISKDLLILEDELKAVAGNLYITTDDGSYERKEMCIRDS